MDVPPPLPTYGLESVELKLQELFVVLVHVAVEDEGSRGREDAVACCVIAVGQGGIRAIFCKRHCLKRRAPQGKGSTENRAGPTLELTLVRPALDAGVEGGRAEGGVRVVAVAVGGAGDALVGPALVADRGGVRAVLAGGGALHARVGGVCLADGERRVRAVGVCPALGAEGRHAGPDYAKGVGGIGAV